VGVGHPRLRCSSSSSSCDGAGLLQRSDGGGGGGHHAHVVVRLVLDHRLAAFCIATEGNRVHVDVHVVVVIFGSSQVAFDVLLDVFGRGGGLQ
jgi:hypothetical protein